MAAKNVNDPKVIAERKAAEAKRRAERSSSQGQKQRGATWQKNARERREGKKSGRSYTVVTPDKQKIIVGGGEYTPGGNGRNASTGDFNTTRQQTIPRVKNTAKSASTKKAVPQSTLDAIQGHIDSLNKGQTIEDVVRTNSLKRLSGKMRNNTTPKDDLTEKMKSYINAGKLTKEQKKEAKAVLKEAKNKREQEYKQGNFDSISGLGTDSYKRFQAEKELEAKTKGAGVRGALLPVLKAANAITKGIENVTNTKNTKAAQSLNEQLESALRQDELSAEQSPIAHGIGNFAGNVAMYTATNPIFDAAATGLGVTSTAGKVIANQLGQNAQDIVLDTLPEYQRLKDMGLSDAEIRKRIGENVGWNVLGNAGAQALSDVVVPAAKQVIPSLKNWIGNIQTNKISTPTQAIPELPTAIKYNGGNPVSNIDIGDTTANVAKINSLLDAVSGKTTKQDKAKINSLLDAISGKTTKQAQDAAEEINRIANIIPGTKAVNNGYDAPGADNISAHDIIDGIRNDINNYSTASLNATTKKNLDYLNGSLDRLETAYKSGENFEDAYEDYRKAMNRVKDNMTKKEGDDYWNKAYKQTLNIKHPDNIAARFNKTAGDSLPTDAEGYLDVSGVDMEDYPFNDLKYDKYGKVIADSEGVKPSRGVDVNQDIRINLRDNAKTSGDNLELGYKLSDVRANTLERSGIDTADELKNNIPEEDFMYIEQPEQVTYEAAKSQLDNDWDRSLAKYTADYSEDSIDNIRSAQDVDAMMLTHERLNEAAREATEPKEKRRLYELSRKVALNLRKAGTKAGQAIQAFAKWTRTPEGAITSAQGYVEDLVSQGLKENPNMAKEINEVSKEINNFLDNMDISAMTREDIEKMIRESILKRKHLKNRVTSGDIRKIADAIINDKQYADIQKELEFLATGFEDIDPETMKQVQDIFERAYELNYNSKERVNLENEAYAILANKICPNGSTFGDKFDAWRYLAMLANPTTHIKNITGNALFGQGMVTAKNTLAALIEEGADRVSKATGNGGIDRTKAILTSADQALVNAAGQDAFENAYRELTGNKYITASTGIDAAIPAFNTTTKAGRFLNKASDINNRLLSGEDEMAALAKYKTSLAGFLKANGADASIFNATDSTSKNLLEAARTYALKQAKEATFHQESEVANALGQFTKNARNSNSKALKALGFTGDIVVPFKKTPINILRSAIEYSPAQYIKVAADIRKLNKGTMKAADFIDDIAKGTTGTVALGIGALLANEGIIQIGSSKSDEEQNFDTQTNRQNVAVKVGDKYIGMSELIPAAAPLILGATIYETIASNKGNENALNTIFSGMSAISNGVTDMTMLSGIADTLNSVRYAQDSSEIWEKLALETGGNLASQMLPTLGRKINTTIDDTKRSTYSDQTGALKILDQNAKYLQTKIPGLQQLGETLTGSDIPALQSVGNRLALQPNVDVKGQIQDSPGFAGMNNVIGRAINNFVSPVSVTKDTSTVYDDERRRLANETGETKVLPYIASSEATINDFRLSPEEWTQYRQQRGQMREELATGIIDSESYKNMSDADRADLLKEIDSFTKAYSQSQFGKDMSSTNQKLAEVYDSGGSDAVINRLLQNKALDEAGISATDKMIDYLESGGDLNDYIAFKDKVTTTTESGNKSIKKDPYMTELAKLPEDQQDIMFEAIGKPSLTKEENAAYKKGGGSAVVDTWEKEKKESASKKKTTSKAKTKNKTKASDTGSTQEQLASYGAIDSPTTVKYYEHARETIPSLTPKGYANYLHKIGGDDYKITQKEMLSYGNNNNLSESDMNRYWKAFGDWKKIPVLVNGTWKAK